jgi:biotin transport system ATP-binding protein
LDIHFEEASVVYEGRTALEPLSVRLSERRIGVIGLNGSGKTTFARLINGLVKPSSGKISVNGFDTVKDAEAVRAEAGFIFQNPQNQIILPILKEDIALGLKRKKLSAEQIEVAVAAVLARFGITHLADRRTHELSGGELQLSAFASVLVTEPKILILDEPTNQLDLKNRNLVERTMAGMAENLIVISHDLALVEGFDRVLMFSQGRLIGDGTPDAVIAQYKTLAGA